MQKGGREGGREAEDVELEEACLKEEGKEGLMAAKLSRRALVCVAPSPDCSAVENPRPAHQKPSCRPLIFLLRPCVILHILATVSILAVDALVGHNRPVSEGTCRIVCRARVVLGVIYVATNCWTISRARREQEEAVSAMQSAALVGEKRQRS